MISDKNNYNIKVFILMVILMCFLYIIDFGLIEINQNISLELFMIPVMVIVILTNLSFSALIGIVWAIFDLLSGKGLSVNMLLFISSRVIVSTIAYITFYKVAQEKNISTTFKITIAIFILNFSLFVVQSYYFIYIGIMSKYIYYSLAYKFLMTSLYMIVISKILKYKTLIKFNNNDIKDTRLMLRRRKHKRIPVHKKVKIKGDIDYYGHSINISLGGILVGIFNNTDIEKDDKVKVIIKEQLNIKGTVVRKNNNNNKEKIAIEFDKNKQEYDDLKTIIENNKDKYKHNGFYIMT